VSCSAFEYCVSSIALLNFPINVFFSNQSDHFTHDMLQCTDKKKHALYKDKKVRASDVAQKKEKKADAQLDAQTVATWQFLGAKTDQLWLLVRHTFNLFSFTFLPLHSACLLACLPACLTSPSTTDTPHSLRLTNDELRPNNI
jgi:hypothetical protein